MKVSAPDGTTWRVNRRWWPWRWKQRLSDRPWDLDPFTALDGADDIASGIVLLLLGVLACFLLPIVLLLLVTGIEWVLLLVVLPFAIIARMAFGKHWKIAVRGNGEYREVDAGSWVDSSIALRLIAADIETGAFRRVTEATAST